MALTRRFLITVCLLAASVALAEPRPATKPSSSPPFAEIVAIERVSLSKADTARLGGREVTINEYLVVYVRLADASRWLPRDIRTETILLGTVPARIVGPPLGRAVPLLVPVLGNDPLQYFALWTLPGDRKVDDMKEGDLLALAKRASDWSGRYVALPAGLLTTPWKQTPKPLTDRRGLQTYVLQRALDVAPPNPKRTVP